MVLVRQPVVEDWQALRDIRLEALRDAPSAFGSTYEREVVRGETTLGPEPRRGRHVPSAVTCRRGGPDSAAPGEPAPKHGAPA